MGVQTSSFVADEDEFSLENAPQAGSADSIATSGWAAGEEAAKNSNNFPEDFTLTEKEQFVKFLDTGGPAAIYPLHFLEKKKGRKGYACLGEGCPLCKAFPDDKASYKYVFTVAEVTEKGVTKKKLTGGVRLFNTLKEADASTAGPLQKHYWTIKKSGEKAATLYHLIPVKARDLPDHGFDEKVVEEAVEKLTPYTRAEVVQEVSHETLLEVVKEVS